MTWAVCFSAFVWLVVLKLAGLLSVSWWIVVSPLIIYAVVVVIFYVIAIPAVLIKWWKG